MTCKSAVTRKQALKWVDTSDLTQLQSCYRQLGVVLKEQGRMGEGQVWFEKSLECMTSAEVLEVTRRSNNARAKHGALVDVNGFGENR